MIKNSVLTQYKVHNILLDFNGITIINQKVEKAIFHK